MPNVTELRLVVTVDDFDAALAIYRDALAMAPLADFSTEQGRAIILDAGHATLELGDPAHAQEVDRIEVGRRVAPGIRVALRVDDAAAATDRAVAAGANMIAPPTGTPWGSINARLDDPAGIQLTLFSGAEDI